MSTKGGVSWVLGAFILLGGARSEAQVPLYVLSQENQLLAVDSVSLHLLDAVQISGEVRSMRATPDGRRLLFASRASDLNAGRLFTYDAQFDGAGGVELMAGPLADLPTSPVDLALTPDGNFAHVTIGVGSLFGGPSNKLQIYDLSDFSLVSETSLTFIPGAIGISPDGAVSWVADPLGAKVHGFYRQAATAFSVTSVNAMPTAIEVSPDNSVVLIANDAETGNPFSRHSLTVLNAATGGLLATITDFEDPPSSILFSPDGGQAFVGATGSSTLTVVDIANLTIIDTLTVGSSPRGLLLAAGGLLFVANSGGNTLSVVDPDTGNVAVGPSVFDGPIRLAGASRVDPSVEMVLSRQEVDADDPFQAELLIRRGLDSDTLVDLYYGILAPGIGIFFMHEDGLFRLQPGPALSGATLSNEDVVIGAGPLGAAAPLGEYIFFALVTPAGLGMTVSGAYAISAASLQLVSSTPPNAAPGGAIESPASGAELAGVVRVEGYASDDHQVQRVDIYLDGVALGAAQYPVPRLDGPGGLSSGWSFPLDLNSVSEGAHSLEAVAIDDEGSSSGALGPVEISVGGEITLDYPWIMNLELEGHSGANDPADQHILLEQDGASLTLTMVDRHSQGTLTGSLDGNLIGFSGSFRWKGNDIDLSYSGVAIDNEHIEGSASGTVNGSSTSGTFTMLRTCYEWPITNPDCFN
ncbi:MAG TPA: Ig-like domain-containing protein [Acidobacteriota bacterium]